MEQQRSWEDSPLLDPAGDLLGRATFANDLAESISGLTTHESVVIALHGPWGSGKSTILNFIETRLDNEPNVLVHRFNPWLIGEDESTLVREFIVSLATLLDAELASGKTKFLDLAHKFAPILRIGGAIVPGATGIASGIDAAHENFGSTLADFKDHLESHLLDGNRSVLIIVDDLDRLSVGQLTTMFRLIKAVGVFSRTRYLLAFDRSVVENSLKETFGSRFVDKIVQVPVPIPEAAGEEILRSFGSDLSAIFERWDFELDADALERKQDLFKYLRLHLTTLRDSKRLSYAIDFAAGIAGGCLDLVDLASYQALMMFSPMDVDKLMVELDGEAGSREEYRLRQNLVDSQVVTAEGTWARFSEGPHEFRGDPRGDISDDEVVSWVASLTEDYDSVSFSAWYSKYGEVVGDRVEQLIFEWAGTNRQDAAKMVRAGLAIAFSSRSWRGDESYRLVRVLATFQSLAQHQMFWEVMALGVCLPLRNQFVKDRKVWSGDSSYSVILSRVTTNGPFGADVAPQQLRGLLDFCLTELQEPKRKIAAWVRDSHFALELFIAEFTRPWDQSFDVASMLSFIESDELEAAIEDHRAAIGEGLSRNVLEALSSAKIPTTSNP